MARTQDTRSLILKRTAIDLSGRLGSLYNGCQDRVLETLNDPFDEPSDHLHQMAQCILIKGDKNQNQNALELIDIDDQLRLSILLDLTSKNGIGKLNDHPHIINEYTRIFRYSYLHREEELSVDLQKMREWLPNITSRTNATHLITGITWGIDIIIILQLPPDDTIVTMIDLTLDKYREYLNGDRYDFKRTSEDIISSEHILDTKIYSNILSFPEMTGLHDLFHNISRLKIEDTKHERLTYTLSPLQSFYHQHLTSNHVYIPLDSRITTKLLHYLLELSTSMKILESCFNENLPNLLCGHLKERFSNVFKQWPVVKRDYINVIGLFSKLVLEVRSGQVRISKIEKNLQSKTQLDLKNRMNNLTQNVIDLYTKAHLISELSYQQIQYYDMLERGVTNNDNDYTLKHKLIVDKNIDRVLCSTDLLNKNNPALFQELRHYLLEERDKNSKLRLIYADFSYCHYQLHQMKILSSSKDSHNKKSKPKEFSSPTGTLQSSTKLSTPKTFTILLLGETGVGKSTFINALFNYLTFQTLDQAQANPPIVAIPVSFPMTGDDHFDEHTVKFGDLSRSTNEDFDHPGQSVTQQCQTYTFNLNTKRRLRIIDTPGLGDTRGLDQDDRNMQHILHYLKQFTNLNAICFLLKPNESSLNILFRSCLTQLVDLLGPNMRENIIFCFTNSRSDLYTAPLLKGMLSSLSIRHIPFKKQNIFCFDNESFRYLVARQNEIPFTDQDRQEYEQSWINSVLESHLLLRYIKKQLIPYPIPDENEEIKQAKIQIVHLTHPMIEVMRYILRNIIIQKMNSLKQSIEPLTNDVLHNIQNDDNYPSLPHQPIKLDFLEDYKIEHGSLSEKQDDMIDHLSLICHISAELGHFLVHVARYRNGDPFLRGLLRLIKEENHICQNQNRNYMNLQLVDGLKKLTNNYEQHIQLIHSNPKQINLANIYQWIKYMNEYPLVSGFVIDSVRANMKDNHQISTI